MPKRAIPVDPPKPPIKLDGQLINIYLALGFEAFAKMDPIEREALLMEAQDACSGARVSETCTATDM